MQSKKENIKPECNIKMPIFLFGCSLVLKIKWCASVNSDAIKHDFNGNIKCNQNTQNRTKRNGIQRALLKLPF